MDRLLVETDRVLAQAPSTCRIFFRADDIAVPGRLFQAMTDTFRAHETPLCLAVTPAWLREDRWREMSAQCDGASSLWCWHQHGWRHVNHQTQGKKGEFGDERTRQAKAADIAKGRDKLKKILGPQFRNYFTPPWNRFDAITGEILHELGFAAVSRSRGAEKKVPLPQGLPDIAINTDLHTRNEKTPETGRDAFIRELTESLATGLCGVMLHHQRMNKAAVHFLNGFLGQIRQHRIPAVAFQDIHPE